MIYRLLVADAAAPHMVGVSQRHGKAPGDSR